MDSAAPKWLTAVRHEVHQSAEWVTFEEELFNAIQILLAESKISHFSDLSSADQRALVDRAVSSLQGSTSYSAMSRALSRSVDSRLCSAEVSTAIVGEKAVSPVESMLDAAGWGAAALLQRWPDLRYQLNECVGSALPRGFRRWLWSWLLSYPSAAAEFEILHNQSALATVSPNDIEISAACEAALTSSPLHGWQSRDRVMFHTMKSVMSYWDTRQTGGALEDYEYALAIPISRVFSAGRSELLDTHFLAQVISHYIKLRGNLKETAWYVDQAGPDAVEIAKSVLELVGTADLPLKDRLVAILGGTLAFSAPAIARLLAPRLRSLFVGALPIETVCVAWDQHLLSVAVNPMPHVCAALLLSASAELLPCNSEEEIDAKLQHSLAAIEPDALVMTMERTGLSAAAKSKRVESAGGAPDAFAVLDSLPPWSWADIVARDEIGASKSPQHTAAEIKRHAERLAMAEKLLRPEGHPPTLEVGVPLAQRQQQASERRAALRSEEAALKDLAAEMNTLDRQVEDARRRRVNLQLELERKRSELESEAEAEVTGKPGSPEPVVLDGDDKQSQLSDPVTEKTDTVHPPSLMVAAASSSARWEGPLTSRPAAEVTLADLLGRHALTGLRLLMQGEPASNSTTKVEQNAAPTSPSDDLPKNL